MTAASSDAVDRSADKPAPSSSSNTLQSSQNVVNDPTPATGATAGAPAVQNKDEPIKTQEAENAPVEVDDFGLPIRARSKPAPPPSSNSSEAGEFADAITNPTEDEPTEKQTEQPTEPVACQDNPEGQKPPAVLESSAPAPRLTSTSKANPSQISEWSHMRLAAQPQVPDEDSEEDVEEEVEWKDMRAADEFDYYDDYGRLVVKGGVANDNDAVYRGLGGAGKGYTRVQLDEDAQSANSLDEDTSYLFRDAGGNSAAFEGEELRDSLSQLQATKDLLNETQKIAYVGVVRLAIHQMTFELMKVPKTKATRKTIQDAVDALRKWGQAMMGRLFMHMEIDSAEQIMIEQLAEHGVQPSDLVRPLMQNARVKNPMAEEESPKKSTSSAASPALKSDVSRVSTETAMSSEIGSPPPYDAHENDDPDVHTPSQMPTSDRIDIDLRWTVLCDLFLVLIADSAYDSRSRTLLENVGAAMDVSWLQICRFEKRVTDALEMQQEAEKENWDESGHMERRRKMALKRKYMVMGLATVGGGLVIGLSAGLLAPVIGAGLAAGFTTVGISGTSAFLGGAGGTALIASGATVTGSTIGLRASNRRTGPVQTFEYRPLHNNKKVNLIVTVAGWMTGKVDDVRLPFSTVDPIMGDLYSVLWEPEMLRSMGDTINILATEALTQGLQQVLGSTVLMALMASLQLPIVLTKLSYLIDNPWSVSLDRAYSAGLIMADSLRDRNLGNRPVTLLGFSLGARVIFYCLRELADKGAFGLVQNVYLFGSPIVAKKDEYLKARSVVSGRFVNGYSTNDWILGYLFRATSGGISRVSGLAAVEGIPGLENFDLTESVNGHMDYRAAMPRLLREVGWEVLGDEFAEIEDPDPDNHAERQRELIREIDEARREAEAKPEKKRFGLFKRGKLAEKKGWETYDVDRNNNPHESSEITSGPGTVLFDIEAIRAELASEAIEVKQLESTLPPMKLDLNPLVESRSAQPSPSNEKESKTGEPTPAMPRTEEEIEMTYDTSYHKSPPTDWPDPPTRPELRSSATVPTHLRTSAVAPVDLEHNAWADHDEGEIQMSFE
ncbi:hypothetical protein N7510_002164 [Penicillium lagena]|uniref:uncharacterized protein n=1 Tax=Penicillium lagena TaxID=94218 RepID=UPI00254114C0|nr:uncharacterized protein N7510_002164 [Penicillium lagena]KAJ5625855.1 hypothetical protein N7510_002164 [Penicillium lagena]